MNLKQGKVSFSLRIIVITWLCSAFFITYQSVGLNRLAENIEELCFGISELQSEFVFPEPFRALHVEKFARTAERLITLRDSTKTSILPFVFHPDVENLFYQTDRFIEQSNHYISVEYQVKELTQTIKQQRELAQISPQAHALYYELGAQVFEVMFTDRAQNPDTYLVFDRIYEKANLLADSEKAAFLQILSEVSGVLTSHAQMTFHIDQLFHHQVNNEQLLVMKQLSEMSIKYMIALVMLATVTIVAMAIWVKKHLVGRIESESVTPNRFESESIQQQEIPIGGEPVDHMPVEEPEYARIDLTTLYETMGEDEEAVAMLLNVFIQDHSEDFEQLKSLTDVDTEAAQRKVHSLKSVSASLGANKLRSLAATIEGKFKHNRPIMPEELNLLGQELEWVLVQVNEHLSRMEK
ncbi:Hpt domain-containing protein [Vibrio maerlii]|uniref:Hpt domain-containing protein n=1 Tax=Vibrio maerlii TaxID=2231648 RepID=UPI0013E0CEED|nr:Hpt domain-containing protein [Vibrio maerlii]